MKRFVEGEDRRQGTLLPEYLEDYVSDENPVRVAQPARLSESPHPTRGLRRAETSAVRPTTRQIARARLKPCREANAIKKAMT
jgi:hypothetical protein